jgi:hypothetical protein
MFSKDEKKELLDKVRTLHLFLMVYVWGVVAISTLYFVVWLAK